MLTLEELRFPIYGTVVAGVTQYGRKHVRRCKLEKFELDVSEMRGAES